jgi:iron(III) transport system ATP-binding protein
LRLIAGFIAPDDGTVVVGGRSLSSPGWALPPERRGMSMIFQSYALWPHMTIRENVGYGLKVRKRPAAEIAERVSAMLAVIQLEHLADRYPGELSGGQQQRVALARALAVKPETLLLDEPLSNLDANLREEMRFEVRRLHDEYKYTTVYVTHDQVEAMTTADVIVVMNRGRIEQTGSPEEIYQQPATEFVARFIGGTNLLKGQSSDGNLVTCPGLTWRCGQGRTASQGETAVSIRLHDVELSRSADGGAETNQARGRVVRQVYLGASRDYLVALEAGPQIRATTGPAVDIAAGSDVWVRFPVESCRALPA